MKDYVEVSVKYAIVSAQEKRMERHIAVAAEVCSRNRRTNHDYHRNGSLSECM